MLQRSGKFLAAHSHCWWRHESRLQFLKMYSFIGHKKEFARLSGLSEYGRWTNLNEGLPNISPAINGIFFGVDRRFFGRSRERTVQAVHVDNFSTQCCFPWFTLWFVFFFGLWRPTCLSKDARGIAQLDWDRIFGIIVLSGLYVIKQSARYIANRFCIVMCGREVAEPVWRNILLTLATWERNAHSYFFSFWLHCEVPKSESWSESQRFSIRGAIRPHSLVARTT